MQWLTQAIMMAQTWSVSPTLGMFSSALTSAWDLRHLSLLSVLWDLPTQHSTQQMPCPRTTKFSRQSNTMPAGQCRVHIRGSRQPASLGWWAWEVEGPEGRVVSK